MSLTDNGIAGEALYAAAYWVARPETVEECADRVQRCLMQLATVDPLLGAWFLKSRRRSTAQVPLRADVGALTKALLGGRNRLDSDRSVIEDLGFRLGIWNGDDDDPVGLSIKCGVSNTTPGLTNAVVLDLPTRSQRCAHLYSSAGVVAALEALVDAWSPDWATVTSNSLREAQGGTSGLPILGWVTYLSRRRGAIPSLPDPFVVRSVGGGYIVTAGRDAPRGPEVIKTLRAMLGPALLESP